MKVRNNYIYFLKRLLILLLSEIIIIAEKIIQIGMDNSNPARKEPRRQPANPICPNFTLLNFLPKNSGIKPTNAPDIERTNNCS